MAALSPTFFSTVRPPAAAVFGGPVEISRLLFLGSRSTPEAVEQVTDLALKRVTPQKVGFDTSYRKPLYLMLGRAQSSSTRSC